MNKNLTKAIFFIALTGFCAISCKKENIQDDERPQELSNSQVNAVIENDRLSFATGQDLEAFFKMGKPESNAFISGFNAKGFVSSLDYENKHGQTKVAYLAKNMSVGPRMETFEELESTDYLVPDPVVASVLNEDLEVAIQGIIYKVTPYGTFIIAEEDYDKLIAILETAGVQTSDLESHPFYTDSIGPETYRVAENIYLYDTYMNATPMNLAVPIDVEEPGDEGGGGDAPSGGGTNTTYTAIQNGDYSSLPVIDFGRHTVVGKWLDSMFGTNEVYKAEFSSKNRMKVALYNTNYVFTKSLGIKVTMQKKNWIGWSGTNAPELRLGWEGISFTKSDNITPVNPWQPLKQSFPMTGNPQWDQTLPPFAKPGAIYREIDLLGYTVNLNVSQSFQKGVKALYDYAKSKGIPAPVKNQQTNLIAWRNAARTQKIIIAGPGEAVDQNTEYLQVNFARSTDVIVSFPTSTSRSALLASLIQTITTSNSAVTIHLDGASIYGVAKYDNKWLGARIDKKD